MRYSNDLAQIQQLIHIHWFAFALGSDRCYAAHQHMRRYPLIHILADQDLSGFGIFLNALCCVHTVSNGSIFKTFFRTDQTQNSLANMHPNPKRQLQIPANIRLQSIHRFADAHSGPNGTHRVVLLQNRRIEPRHHCITHEFVNGTFFVQHSIRCCRQIAVQTETSRSGDNPSLKLVKPRISANTTVISARRPPSCKLSGSS